MKFAGDISVLGLLYRDKSTTVYYSDIDMFVSCGQNESLKEITGYWPIVIYNQSIVQIDCMLTLRVQYLPG